MSNTPDGIEYGNFFTLITHLRALHMLHQTMHWAASGPQFYSDHLLHQRIYEGIAEEIDAVGERMILEEGLPDGWSLVGSADNVAGMVEDYDGWNMDGRPVAVLAEQELLAYLAIMRNGIESSVWDSTTNSIVDRITPLSQGLENLLSGIADKHETYLYLLRQRYGDDTVEGETRTASRRRRRASSSPMTAETYFVPQPKDREVLELARSKAPSNDPTVIKNMIRQDQTDDTPRELKRKLEDSPLTVDEVLELPGAKMFSTLNRYVLETDDPRAHPGLPSSRDEVIALRVASRWLDR